MTPQAPPPESDPVATAVVAQRYGRQATPGSRRRRWIAGVVGAGAALALLAWIAWDVANPPVRWNDIAFDVNRNDVTVVTFETVMEPGATATCRVRALDAGYAEVGVAQVTVGPSDERVVRMRTTLRTTGQAVTGGVAECTGTGTGG